MAEGVQNYGMSLVRALIRLLILVTGALIGVGLFLFAVVAFVVVLIFSLLTGKRPNLQFRANANPWARRDASTGDDVVDIEAREVKDSPPLPLQPPQR